MLLIILMKALLLCVCVISLDAYIFSYSYASRLVEASYKILTAFETKAQTYTYLRNNLIQYTNNLGLLLEAADDHQEKEDFVSNPIYAFKLIKALSIDFEKLSNIFASKHALEFGHIMEETVASNKLSFPSIKDLRGVCQAIIRLQDIYDIDEENIISGNFQNYWNGSLTKNDLRELRRCYEYQKKLDVRHWLSSETIYNSEDDTAEIFLAEVFKALKAFSETTKVTTKKLFEIITLHRQDTGVNTE